MGRWRLWWTSRAGQSDDPVRTGYRSGSGHDVRGTGIMSHFFAQEARKHTVLYCTVQISTPINDRGPHERKIKKCAFAQGIERGEEREIEKISADDGTGKGERSQNFAGFGRHVRSLLRLWLFFLFFFFLRTQISLSYHPPDLYHSRTRGGD